VLTALAPTLAWAPNAKFTFNVFASGQGTLQQQTVAVTGTESVTVPAGTFQAYRVEAAGGSSPLVLWLRAEGPHVTVKQEVVGQPFVVELTAER